MRKWLLFGWVFFVMNATSDPVLMPGPFVSKADCDAARTWAIQSHFKTATPDATAAANYASQCYEQYNILH